ncbi:arginine vasopressin-induced protein 1 [Polypterus senegalus]|nr:arginine vasopressin-induced protein 1 [Polypterus senegalus]
METTATMELWRHCSRRNRKAAFHNIFWGVNLCQLQRLFKESGDKRAEQRARLIWDTSDESELAKVLTGLRGGRNRGHKQTAQSSNSRCDSLGPRWMKDFGKMRISEEYVEKTGDGGDGSETELVSSGGTGPTAGPPLEAPKEHFSHPTSDSKHSSQTSSHNWKRHGLREGRQKPERYLHRVLH